MNGPVTGPLIGGFVYEYLGWRWTNWLVVILSKPSILTSFMEKPAVLHWLLIKLQGGAAWAGMSMLKETYAPAILKRKAAQRRKETGDNRWWCRYDQRISVMQVLKTNLSRPFIMTATEPILWFWDLYIAVIYGILYLCFVAYPIIFTELRGWSPGISGLGFCGIGLGTSKHNFISK